MKLALISDIHEDVVNLKLALYKIEKQACDEIICLGDISGFSVPHYRYFDTRDAQECLRIVRENCSIIVLGNHDLQAARKLPDYCPDFNFPENWYDLDYHVRKSLGHGKVWLYDHDELDPLYPAADKEYLATLPQLATKKIAERKLLFSHYLYPNLTGSLVGFYHTHDGYQQHFDFMQDHHCDISFTGHYHSGGLSIATKNRMIQKGFRRKYVPNGPSVVVIPSITGNRMSNGFCIFDTDENWIKAVRV